MLTKYLRAAMRLAKYEIQKDGNYFGSIPGLDGAWASAVTGKSAPLRSRFSASTEPRA
jgi:hypothetical protein